jgi:hypothetical protein
MWKYRYVSCFLPVRMHPILWVLSVLGKGFVHIAIYSRRSFMWESKHWKHPNNGIVLKGFLRHTLFKLVYFLPYLMSHIIYLALHAKTSLFDRCALLWLIYVNSGNIINPEQVRSWTFHVNDLLYLKNCLHL